jgi:hypothetical protein
VRAETAARVSDALGDARDALAGAQQLPSVVMGDPQAVAELIAASIASHPDAALCVADLAGPDEYTHCHSVNVTALGLLLARAH